MEEIASGLWAVATVVPLLVAAGLLGAAWRLRRVRWRRAPLGLARPAAVAPQVRATLDGARPFLAGAGFAYRYTTASDPVREDDPRPLVLNDVYQHADQRTHAVVTIAPDAPRAWTVLFVSQLRSGHVLATTNCDLHRLVVAPPGWQMEDGYRPDVAGAWQRHQERLPENALAVVTDGVEFFHANKQAVDGFIAQCEKRGLMAQHGGHWQLRWGPALAYAWRLLVGRRKAARARRQAAPQPAGPARVRSAPAS